MLFKVHKKSGFKCLTKDLIIFCNGLPFFVKSNFNGGCFNLPRGKYELIKGNFIKDKILNYTLPKLPKRYNFDKSPNGFKVVFCVNPNKCSVDLYKKIIYFDTSFKEQPIQVLDFVQGHELGHFRYSGKGLNSEVHCDIFAVYFMLIRGYNPSQINYACQFTLSNSKESEIRKKIINDLTNKIRYV